jgi:hypothetical protein
MRLAERRKRLVPRRRELPASLYRSEWTFAGPKVARSFNERGRMLEITARNKIDEGRGQGSRYDSIRVVSL